MRNTSEPGDLRTGLLVLGAIGLVVGGIVWVSPMRGPKPVEFFTELPELSSVSLETPVILKGFRVGQVDLVEPAMSSDGKMHFRIGMAITWQPGAGQTPYRAGMRVRVTPPALDVFGGATLTLEPSPTPGAPLGPGSFLPSSSETAMLAKTDVRIDSLTQQVALTLSDLRKTMGAFRLAADASANTLRTAGTMTATVDHHLANLTASTLTAITRTDSVLQGVQAMEKGALGTTDSLNALLGDSRKTLKQLSAVLANTAPKLDDVLFNLDESSAVLTHFLRSVSEKPTRALTGVTPPPLRVRRDTTVPPE